MELIDKVKIKVR